MKTTPLQKGDIVKIIDIHPEDASYSPVRKVTFKELKKITKTFNV